MHEKCHCGGLRTNDHLITLPQIDHTVSIDLARNEEKHRLGCKTAHPIGIWVQILTMGFILDVTKRLKRRMGTFLVLVTFPL